MQRLGLFLLSAFCLGWSSTGGVAVSAGGASGGSSGIADCGQTIHADGDQTSGDPEVSIEAAEAALVGGENTICVLKNLVFTSNDSVNITTNDVTIKCAPGVSISKDSGTTHNTSMFDWDGADGHIDGCIIDFNGNTNSNTAIDGAGAARLKITNNTFQGITLTAQSYFTAGGGSWVIDKNIFTTDVANLGRVFGNTAQVTGLKFTNNTVGTVGGNRMESAFGYGIIDGQVTNNHFEVVKLVVSNVGWNGTLIADNQFVWAADELMRFNPGTQNMMIENNHALGTTGVFVSLIMGSGPAGDQTSTITVRDNWGELGLNLFHLNMENPDTSGLDDLDAHIVIEGNRGQCSGDCILIDTAVASGANWDITLDITDNHMEGIGNDGFFEATFLNTDNSAISSSLIFRLNANDNSWFNTGTLVDEDLFLVEFLQAVGANPTYDLTYALNIEDNELRTTDADALDGIAIDFGLGANVNSATGTIKVKNNDINNAGDSGIVIDFATIASAAAVTATALDVSGNTVVATTAGMEGIFIKESNAVTPVITGVKVNDNILTVGTGFCIQLSTDMAGGTLNNNTCTGTNDGICPCAGVVDNFAISGNYISVNDGGSTSVGFVFANGSDGHSVVGNTIVDNGGTWATYNSVAITDSTNDITGGNSFISDEDTTATDDPLNTEP